MPIFERIMTKTEAEQFLGGDKPLPKGVKHSELLGYYVEMVYDSQRKLVHGDWVLPEKDGIHYYAIKDEIFKQMYCEPLTHLQQLETLLYCFKIDHTKKFFEDEMNLIKIIIFPTVGPSAKTIHFMFDSNGKFLQCE